MPWQGCSVRWIEGWSAAILTATKPAPPDRRLAALRDKYWQVLQAVLAADCPVQVGGGDNLPHVAESLREVAEQLPGAGIGLFAQEPQVVAAIVQPIVERSCPFSFAGERQAGDQPVGTKDKGPLLAPEAVQIRSRRDLIAEYTAVLGQIVSNRLDRRPHPRLGRGQETD